MNKNGWQVKTLSEVIEKLESGGRPKGGGLLNGDFPSLGAEHLNDQGGFKLESMKYIPKDYFKSMQRGIITKNDILIVKDGATTGKVSIVKNDFPYNQVAINEHLFLVRTKKNLLDPLFAFYFLYSCAGKSQIMTDFRGSAQGGISREFINKVSIPLPQLPIQKQIAEILEKADNAKQKREKANKLTDTFLHSIFIEMFGDPILNDKNWPIIKLSKVCPNITKGTTPKRDEINSQSFVGAIPFLKVYHIMDDYSINFNYKPSFVDIETHQQNLKRSIVYPDDILMNIVGPPLGKIAIVPDEYPEWNVNQALAIFRCSKLIDSRFLLYSLNNKSILKSILNLAVGIRQQNLSLDQCKNITIPLPPIYLQKKFAEIAKKTTLLRKNQKQSEQVLENLFQSLVQRAFKGELVIN